MGIPSGVIKHVENPRTEWGFLARKISDKDGPFSIAMFVYRKVYSVSSNLHPTDATLAKNFGMISHILFK